MGNARTVWLDAVFCFSPLFVRAVSTAGGGFIYCFKEHCGHAFFFAGFRNLKGLFRPDTQKLTVYPSLYFHYHCWLSAASVTS